MFFAFFHCFFSEVPRIIMAVFVQNSGFYEEFTALFRCALFFGFLYFCYQFIDGHRVSFLGSLEMIISYIVYQIGYFRAFYCDVQWEASGCVTFGNAFGAIAHLFGHMVDIITNAMENRFGNHIKRWADCPHYARSLNDYPAGCRSRNHTIQGKRKKGVPPCRAG